MFKINDYHQKKVKHYVETAMKYINFKVTTVFYRKSLFTAIYNEHARSTVEIHYEYHSNASLQFIAQNMSS